MSAMAQMNFISGVTLGTERFQQPTVELSHIQVSSTFSSTRKNQVGGGCQQKVSLAKSTKCTSPGSSGGDGGVAAAGLSKNALMARENRLKKKHYVNTLEESLAAARKESEDLKDKLRARDNTIVELQQEVLYLKRVLCNGEQVSKLIKAVRSSGLPVTTSLALPTGTKRTHEQTVQSSESQACGIPSSTLLETPRAKTARVESVGSSNGSAESCLLSDEIDGWLEEKFDLESVDILPTLDQEDIDFVFGTSCAVQAQDNWSLTDCGAKQIITID